MTPYVQRLRLSLFESQQSIENNTIKHIHRCTNREATEYGEQFETSNFLWTYWTKINQIIRRFTSWNARRQNHHPYKIVSVNRLNITINTLKPHFLKLSHNQTTSFQLPQLEYFKQQKINATDNRTQLNLTLIYFANFGHIRHCGLLNFFLRHSF